MSSRRHADSSRGARKRPWWRRRWWMPLVSLALGGILFAAMAVGGNPGDGAKSFAVMAAVAAAFAFGTRSETLQGLGGPARDERWELIDLRATALAGMVTLTAILGCWLWELAHGRDGGPYGQLAAVGGVAYVVAVAVGRRRG